MLKFVCVFTYEQQIIKYLIKQLVLTDNAMINESIKDIKICSNCQKENPQEAKHCMECGSKF
jgi:ribosomal protein L40E